MIERLGIANTAELQDLLERCSDYFETCENRSTPPDAARDELLYVPPGRTPDDYFVFGLRDDSNRLIGINEMIQHWPRHADEWWLAGQLLDPAHRNRGLGASFYREMERWVVAPGGRVIQASVVERNSNAERFWKRIGFREIERQDSVAPGGWKTRVIIMRRDVQPDAPQSLVQP